MSRTAKAIRHEPGLVAGVWALWRARTAPRMVPICLKRRRWLAVPAYNVGSVEVRGKGREKPPLTRFG